MPSSDPPTFILNLHTADPKASGAFYSAIGFSAIPSWSDDKTQALGLPAPASGIRLMIHHASRFGDWLRPGTSIADVQKATEAIYTLTAPSKEHVDDVIDKVVKAGGKPDPFEMPGRGSECGMYTRSFTDLDGHIWEIYYSFPQAPEDRAAAAAEQK